MPLNPSLRRALAESYVADVAIAWLVLRSLQSAFWVVWLPIERIAGFLITAIAILDVPYHSRTLDVVDRMQLIEISGNLISALTTAGCAWTLSRWMYGTGPIRSLSISCNKLRRSSHV